MRIRFGNKTINNTYGGINYVESVIVETYEALNECDDCGKYFATDTPEITICNKCEDRNN